MTRTRTEFPESVKRAALERAGYRCQDKLCATSPEWKALWAELAAAWPGFELTRGPDPANPGFTKRDLTTIRDLLMSARFKHRALRPIIKRFKLDGGALLEVDHEREDADGGAATLDNAMVRCVFCHLFKTLERAKRRRKGPQIAKKQPEQLDLVHRAKVEGLRIQLENKLSAQVGGHLRDLSSRGNQSERWLPNRVGGFPGKVVRVDPDGQVNLPALHRAMSTPILAPEPEAKPRRHTSESAFQAAAQRRERAILDNDGFFGA